MSSLASRSVARIALAGALLLLASAAFAIINPTYTPVHLTDGAEQIALVRADARPDARSVPLAVVEALKGGPVKQVTLDFSAAPPEQTTAGLDLLVRAGQAPCLLFLNRREGKGYLHVNGNWLALAAGPGDGWTFKALDPEMLATWNGGTDMLARCVKYVLAAGEAADVPCAASSSWRKVAKIGTAPANATLNALAVLDLKGDGTLYLYVAGDKGVDETRHERGRHVRDDRDHPRAADGQQRQHGEVIARYDGDPLPAQFDDPAGLAQVGGGLLDGDDGRDLGKPRHRFGQQVDSGAARDVVQHDRDVHPLGDMGEVAKEPLLGRLVVVGSDQQRRSGPHILRVARQPQRFARRPPPSRGR